MTNVIRDPLVSEVIDAAIEVHRALGPGLLESAYQTCLGYELKVRRLEVEVQVPVPLAYKNIQLDCGYRLDFVVNGQIILEVKSVEALTPIHTAQVLTYLRLTGARQALLINFNCATLRHGLRSYLGKGRLVP